MFVNRKKEREELPKIFESIKIKSENNSKSILFIYGNQGIGKSCLIEEIVKLMKLENNFLSIEGSPNKYTAKEYYHVDLLVNEIKKHHNNSTQFILHFPSCILQSLSKFIKSKTYGIADFTQNEVGKKITFIKNNIRSSITPYYIFFKNTQNIEQESMDVFFALAKDLDNVLFIFEYLCSPDDFYKLQKNLNKKLDKSGIKEQEREYYAIDKIEFDEIKKIFNLQKNQKSKLKEIKKEYEKNSGSIDYIIAKYGNYTVQNSEVFDYAWLDTNEKIILQILLLFNKQMTLEELKLILDSSTLTQLNIKYEKILEFLKKNNFIDKQNNICILSKSILQSIPIDKKTPENIIAYQCLNEYYRKTKNVIALYELFCLYNDKNILGILSEVRSYLMSKKYPQDILNTLEVFLQKINYNEKVSRTDMRITMFAIEMFIHINNYEKGKYYLEKIFDSKCDAHIILLAGLISVENKSVDNQIEKIDKLLQQYSKDSRVALIINLYKLEIYMEHKSFKETKKFINELENVKPYHEYKEYCYLLRNKAEIADINEGQNIYYECLTYVMDDNPTFTNEINISLSMNYAHLGNLSKAKECNQKAEQSIGKGIREYYILNNRAVINMLNNKFNKQVLEDLQNAYILSANPYDQIIIASNLLVCMIKIGETKKAKQVKNYLLSVDINDYGYEELQHIYYQNLLFYYTWQNNTEKIHEYRNYIHELIKRLDSSSYTYKIAKLQFEKKVDQSVFYSQFPYRVDFLGYWDFNICLDDFL